jgi:endo-1,4-beta-xylanase
MKIPWLFTALIVSACAGATPNANPNPENNAASNEMTLQALALPTGGTDVLGADPITAFKGYSSEEVKLETVPVNGQSFTQAYRATGLKPLAQPYLSQLSANTVAPIAKDDVLLVQFWARSIGGKPAQTEFLFEDSVTYDKFVNIGVNLTPSWVLYSVPFNVPRDFPSGTGLAHFRLGYNNQALELGGMVLKNFAKTQTRQTLPFTGFSYVGREQNAAWRSAANARIDQIRKTDLRIKVIDATGKAVPNATVKLEMQRHAFRFGSVVDADLILSNDADALKYKQTIRLLFNHAVFGNDLKWPDWEGYFGSVGGRSRVPEALKFFQTNNISMRGHNLLWPCEADYCLPNDVPALLNNPTALRSRIDAHFVDILGATKGKIVEWDVINEPSANKRISNVLGEDEMAAQFKRAKQLDSAAKMFLNDYGNLGEGGDLEGEYKRIISRLLALKAPVEGIGLQGHFGYKLTPPVELTARFADLGNFGLPLAITEFDVNMLDEKLQADYLRDFMTVAFSSPSVQSFLMWGFWEGRHWLPDAAMYRTNWSLKPNGQAYKDLLFKRWWTNTTGSSNANGQYSTRGFLGDYKLTVIRNGKTLTRNFKLEKSSAEVVIKLP